MFSASFLNSSSNDPQVLLEFPWPPQSRGGASFSWVGVHVPEGSAVSPEGQCPLFASVGPVLFLFPGESKVRLLGLCWSGSHERAPSCSWILYRHVHSETFREFKTNNQTYNSVGPCFSTLVQTVSCTFQSYPAQTHLSLMTVIIELL